MRPILLDTCAAIWLANRSRLSDAAIEAAREALSGDALFVSPITAWEVGMLVSRGRLALAMEPTLWFAQLLEAGIKLARTSPDILITASFLPQPSLRDPADRIIAATARANGYSLMTRDRPLLDFGAAGHLHVTGC